MVESATEVADSASELESKAEDVLASKLQAWHSRFRYSFKLLSIDEPTRVVKFLTEWSRRPTPNETVPDVRVNVEFTVKYYKNGQSKVTYRLEKERFTNEAKERNIDNHILRVLKYKATAFKDKPLHIEQAPVFVSRLQYVNSTPDAQEQARADVEAQKSHEELEKMLINMFASADLDGNGSLDEEEFQQMLMKSDLGLSADDIDVVLGTHDMNDDGLLVYREFVPIAVDLIQAQRAVTYANEMVIKNKEDAAIKAKKRVQACHGLPRHVDTEIGKLEDKFEDGIVPAPVLRKFLMQIPDLNMNADETEYVTSYLKVEGDENKVAIEPLHEKYEEILIKALADHTVNMMASNVELYLVHLFRKIDVNKTGLLPPESIATVLKGSEKIKLTPLQIHAIMSPIKNETGVDYKTFASKASYMIYKIFDKASMNQKNTALKRSAIAPIELLGGNSKEKIERQMYTKFREFDLNDSGFLTREDFRRCLADTSLCLSTRQINDLFQEYDVDGDNLISITEFMNFAYNSLLNLARNAALQAKKKPTAGAS